MTSTANPRASNVGDSDDDEVSSISSKGKFVKQKKKKMKYNKP